MRSASTWKTTAAPRTTTLEKRIQWSDLPSPLKAAIEKRTGPITAGHAVTDGQNSPLAAVIDTGDGKVFVKGLSSDHPLVITQEREAAAAPARVPHLPGLALALR
jgi:hypothetical protein